MGGVNASTLNPFQAAIITNCKRRGKCEAQLVEEFWGTAVESSKSGRPQDWQISDTDCHRLHTFYSKAYKQKSKKDSKIFRTRLNCWLIGIYCMHTFFWNNHDKVKPIDPLSPIRFWKSLKGKKQYLKELHFVILNLVPQLFCFQWTHSRRWKLLFSFQETFSGHNKLPQLKFSLSSLLFLIFGDLRSSLMWGWSAGRGPQGGSHCLKPLPCFEVIQEIFRYILH